MINFIKKYLDVILGILFALIMSFATGFNSERISSISSLIVFILVSIGLFKVIRDRKNVLPSRGIVDKIVDSQKPVKAGILAEHPTKIGEELGKGLINMVKGVKIMWSTIKKFFDKYKGYILTILLGVLGLLAENLDFIYKIFDGKLIVNGYNVISIALTILAIIVGLMSNSLTSSDNKLIKKIVKSKCSNKEDIKALVNAALDANDEVKNDEESLDISKELHSSINAVNKEIKKLSLKVKEETNKLKSNNQLINKTQKLV